MNPSTHLKEWASKKRAECVLKHATPGSKVRYGGAEYEVARVERGMVGIYDEPPSLHVDFINPRNLTFITKYQTTMKTGIELIAAERERQITAEGWSATHDDQHKNAELERAALCYLDVASSQVVVGGKGETYGPPDEWPWELESWKPADDPLRNMAKAGSLIAAAMDRFIRHNA